MYMNGCDIDKYRISLLHDGQTNYSPHHNIVPTMNIFKCEMLPAQLTKNIKILSAQKLFGIILIIHFV